MSKFSRVKTEILNLLKIEIANKRWYAQMFTGEKARKYIQRRKDTVSSNLFLIFNFIDLLASTSTPGATIFAGVF